MTACTRHAHIFASYDILCLDGMAIDLLACLVVRTKRRAFKRNTGKQTAGTRVAKDLGSHPSVGICGSITSFGACGNGSISAQLNLTAQDRLHAAVIHDQQDQVRRLATDLEADTATFQRVHGWGSPRSTELLARPANHGSAPVVSVDSKSKLSDRRDHDDALGLFQKLMVDAVWDVEHFLHDNTA